MSQKLSRTVFDNKPLWMSVFLAMNLCVVAYGQSEKSDQSKTTPKATRNILGPFVTKEEMEKRNENAKALSEGVRTVIPPVERPSVGTREQVLQKAVAARSNGWISDSVRDSTFEGTLTLFTVEGPQAKPEVTFDVTLLRKGDRQLQRIIQQNGRQVRQGSDGTKSWSSVDGMSSNVAGHTLHFIESFTDRSVQALFKAPSKAASGVEVHDLGMKGVARVLEVQDPPARPGGAVRKTQYRIDPETSLISRIDMVTGEVFDTFANQNIETTESVVFSDYREVGGVMTPFKIESFINGIKAEEMQFKTVAHNQSIPDRAFQPPSPSARN